MNVTGQYFVEEQMNNYGRSLLHARVVPMNNMVREGKRNKETKNVS